MATYLELYALSSNNDPLMKKVAVAAVIKAQSYTAGTPTPAQVQWSREILSDPRGKAPAILFAVLAANKAATVAQINGATDAQIQTHVDLVIDKIFANAGT